MDFINKLLKKQPSDRLGVAADGISIDFKEIVSHPFLADRYNDRLFETEPPEPVQEMIGRKSSKNSKEKSDKPS